MVKSPCPKTLPIAFSPQLRETVCGIDYTPVRKPQQKLHMRPLKDYITGIKENTMLKHAEYMERINHHIEADNLIRGTGWKHGKGCAVGCTFEYYDHARAARETNVPEWLWHLEDTLFEGMSLEKSRTWPREFFQRTNFTTPADVWEKQVKAPFLVMMLNTTLTTFDHAKYPDVKAAIDGSIALWKRDDIGSDDWESAAESAAWVAESAARAAAWAAAWAARAAARASTKASAMAVEWAAESTARADRSYYDSFADGLLRIMDEAPALKDKGSQISTRSERAHYMRLLFLYR